MYRYIAYLAYGNDKVATKSCDTAKEAWSWLDYFAKEWNGRPIFVIYGENTNHMRYVSREEAMTK